MTSKMFIRALAVGAMFSAAPAFAQQTTSTSVLVALEVQDGCVINGSSTTSQSTALLSFGSIQNAGGQGFDLTGSTTAGLGTPITVSCNVNSTSAAFSLDGGQNASGGTRRLRNPSATTGSTAEFIPYQVYQDVARTAEYLISTPRTVNGGVIAAGTPFNVDLFGFIARANVLPAVAGDYSDNLIGTLSF